MTEAFAKSINTIAVQIADQVGVGNIIDIAHRMGVSSDIEYNLSIALGTSSINVLELTSAYATIANNGIFTKPYSIETIKNSNTGTLLYLRKNVQEPRIISEEVVEGMKKLLRSCVLKGSAQYASLRNFKISGKTGTSQEHRDAWFVGFSDKYVIGVWLGNEPPDIGCVWL